MVYSGFCSSYEFLEFRIHIQTRIRIQSIFNQFRRKEEFAVSTICYFLFFILLVQSYSTHSPEFTGLNFEIKFLLICSFFLCWIRNNNSGSVRIQIHNTAFRGLKSRSTVSCFRGRPSHDHCQISCLTAVHCQGRSHRYSPTLTRQFTLLIS